eukprot:snap_masked-scaffold_34-processed-gene-1.32-mRNA-1 protein AED:0.00 eAED:0.00 QI:53/1/1/1/0.5/0.33/3/151/501
MLTDNILNTLRKVFEEKHNVRKKTTSILLSGFEGIGKRFLVRKVSEELKIPCFKYANSEEFVDEDGCFPFLTGLSDLCLKVLDISTNFDKFILIFDDREFSLDPYSNQWVEFFKLLSQEFPARVLLFYLTSEVSKIPSSFLHIFSYSFVLDIPSIEQREKIFSSLLPNSPSLAKELSRHSHGFLPKDIINVFQNEDTLLLSLGKTIDDIIDKIKNTVPSLLSTQFKEVGSKFIALSPADIETTLDKVYGLQNEKKILKDIFSQVYSSEYIDTGIIFHGPPGTGKTLLAAGIAKESGYNFMYVSIGTLILGEIGESEKGLARLFETARAMSPVVLFVDELQAAFGERRSRKDSIVSKLTTQLLLEFEKIEEESKHVIVIGATNILEKIDSSLLRKNRFGLQLEIALPNIDVRLQILTEEMGNHSNWADDVDVQELAALTKGWSPADLFSLHNDASLASLEKAFMKKMPSLESPERGIEDMEITISQADLLYVILEDSSKKPT